MSFAPLIWICVKLMVARSNIHPRKPEELLRYGNQRWKYGYLNLELTQELPVQAS